MGLELGADGIWPREHGAGCLGSALARGRGHTAVWLRSSFPVATSWSLCGYTAVYSPFPHVVGTWPRTSRVLCSDERVSTSPSGSAQGWTRLVSNNGQVLGHDVIFSFSEKESNTLLTSLVHPLPYKVPVLVFCIHQFWRWHPFLPSRTAGLEQILPGSHSLPTLQAASPCPHLSPL